MCVCGEQLGRMVHIISRLPFLPFPPLNSWSCIPVSTDTIVDLFIFYSLNHLSFWSFAHPIELSLMWASGRCLSTELWIPPPQYQPQPFCFLSAVNQAGKEALVKPLIISVETDDIEGGVHSFTLFVCMSLFPLYKKYILSCRVCSCLIGEAAVFIV